MEVETSYASLHQLARKLGLSRDWLKGEAKAGRIPFLPTKRRMMFNVKAVEQALNLRAQREAVVGE